MANQYKTIESKLNYLNQNINPIYEYVHFKPTSKATSTKDNLGYYGKTYEDTTAALPMTELPGLYTKKDCEFNAALQINNSYTNSTKAYYALLESDNKNAPSNVFSCYVATTEKNPNIDSAIQRGPVNPGVVIWECFNTNNQNEKRMLDANNYLVLSDNGDFSIYNRSGQVIKTLAVGQYFTSFYGNILHYTTTVSLENDGILYWSHPVLGRRAISTTNTNVLDKLDAPASVNVKWQLEMNANNYKSQIQSGNTNNQLSYKKGALISQNGVYRLEMNPLGNLVIRMYTDKPFHRDVENGDTAYFTRREMEGLGQDFYPYSVEIDPKMDKTFFAMNYPNDEGKLSQEMIYISPDHPNFHPSTDYEVVENVYSNTEGAGGGVFSKSDV